MNYVLHRHTAYAIWLMYVVAALGNNTKTPRRSNRRVSCCGVNGIRYRVYGWVSRMIQMKRTWMAECGLGIFHFSYIFYLLFSGTWKIRSRIVVSRESRWRAEIWQELIFSFFSGTKKCEMWHEKKTHVRAGISRAFFFNFFFFLLQPIKGRLCRETED